ncbi:MAG: glycosyltransferase [Propioniciclava sp.]|uniref:glycosyltransferase n=1 Tax=Propioniciclava sp. TaxID=2038686 RepID=UPI0039E56BE1
MTGGPIVWVAGVGWDDVPGTDKQLVLVLGREHEVIWVDAPRKHAWRGWLRGTAPAVESVAPGVLRARIPALPGFTRWPIRYLTDLLTARCVRLVLRGRGRPRAVVVANPIWPFPAGVAGTKVLYVTDDWIAGAGLMGLSTRWVTERLGRKASQSERFAAITEPLVAQARELGLDDQVPVALLPNGAPVVEVSPGHREPVAGVVGQINERTDLACLEAVAEAGVRVRIMGPRADRDPEFGRRFEALLRHPNVTWLGVLGTEELAAELSRMSVGLTAYADSVFNEASFPLKTLEYLAAGVPVVSTDLPASHWLDTPHVRIAGDPAGFAALVAAAIEETDGHPGPHPGEADRIAFARTHGWDARARAFIELLDS